MCGEERLCIKTAEATATVVACCRPPPALGEMAPPQLRYDDEGDGMDEEVDYEMAERFASAEEQNARLKAILANMTAVSDCANPRCRVGTHTRSSCQSRQQCWLLPHRRVVGAARSSGSCFLGAHL